MPRGYTLNPNAQMKIEDERAGRLDYAYETSLSIEECQKRIGSVVNSGKLTDYETEIKDGILYISFIDPDDSAGGLCNPLPQKYAVRFESMADKTIIRARFLWDNDACNVQYLLREDINAFFISLFDARVAEQDKTVWTDSGEEFVRNDPLKLHGTKKFWVAAAIFIVVWFLLMMQMMFE